MKKSIVCSLTILLLLPLLLSVNGCGCGFDCNDNGGDSNEPALLTLGLSDAIPEALKQFVIEVDSIAFIRSGADNVVIDTFTIPEQGLTDADTFQIDLLAYRGANQLIVLENLALDTGFYNEILIEILGDDINRSYAQEADDSLREVTVTNGVLSLPGISLSAGTQVFTVEFALAQALLYQSSPGRYLLTASGIRIEHNVTAARLSGSVDRHLFNTVSPCSEKNDPEEGNRVYLYQGTGLEDRQLADVYTSASSVIPPDNAAAPFAVASLVENTFTGSWEYAFGFLPAGDYTLAFSCNTADDNAVAFDNLTIALPEEQLYEITLSESEKAVCNMTDNNPGC